MPLTASPDRPYGWRARVGFITPTGAHENNQYEFFLMAPDGVTMVMTSLHVSSFDQSGYDSAIDRLEAATREIAGRRPNSIIQAGVPLVVTHGWGYEAEVLGRIARVTSIPAATDIGSCIDAMKLLGMRRVAMFSPFDDRVENYLVDYLRHAGIDVVHFESALDTLMPDQELRAYEVSTLDLKVVGELAEKTFRAASGADGLWITGAIMPSVAVIDSLERKLGVPVVTSMQAMAWKGLRLAGVNDPIKGFGRLLQVA